MPSDAVRPVGRGGVAALSARRRRHDGAGRQRDGAGAGGDASVRRRPAVQGVARGGSREEVPLARRRGGAAVGVAAAPGRGERGQ